MNTTKYALEILNCPPDPSKIKAVMYTSPTKLSVVDGSAELMSIDLQNFFVQVDNAQKGSFVLPAKGEAYIPAELFTYSFGEMGAAKFVAFFPDYGTGASGADQYIEWNHVDEIEQGPLSTTVPLDIIARGFAPRITSGMASIPGYAIGFKAETAKVIATDGGIKLWSAEDGTKLLCEFNSEMQGCRRSCVHVDASNNIWTGSFYRGVNKITWGDDTFSFELFNTETSGISGNVIYDIKSYGSKIAFATNNGISILDTSTDTWKNYGRYNVNQITSSTFNTVYIDSEYIIGGCETGVFVYTILTDSWEAYSSITLPGWTGTNDVKVLEIVDGEIFAGTTSTILTFPIGATFATEIPNDGYQHPISNIYSIGASGSTSSFFKQGMTGFTVQNTGIVTGSLQNVAIGGVTVGFTATYISGTFPNTSIHVELPYSGTQGSTLSFSYTNAKIHTISAINYVTGVSGNDKLNVGYLEGGISRYDFENEEWDFNYDGLIGSTGTVGTEINYGVRYLTPDNYWGNQVGYNLFDADTLSYTVLPSTTENADILATFPRNLDYNISLTQSVFVVLSKPVASSVLETHFNWGTAPQGSSMPYEITSFQGGGILKVSLPFTIFGTGPNFTRSTGYNFSIGESLTAIDGTYFRQTVNSTFYTLEPQSILGWHIVGKQMVLSGTTEKPVEPIIFRNPHNFPVTITVLAAL